MSTRNNRVPVSVLIPVKNEAAHIRACVESVAWAGDIVVVDSHSTDGTGDIASSLGARVVQFNYVAGALKKKNWALANVDFRNDWVLILDADERITPGLAREISQVIAGQPAEAGFYINRRFYFLNQWIRHCGYYPSWNLRLFRRSLGRYEVFSGCDTQSGDNEVHEHVILNGKAGRLQNPMDHFAYLSIQQFVEKHARYANWEAQLGELVSSHLNASQGGSAIEKSINLRRRLKALARQLPIPHWLRFAYHYFLRLGVLDGKNGYILCHLLAEYEFLIWAKRHEIAISQKAQTHPCSS